MRYARPTARPRRSVKRFPKDKLVEKIVDYFDFARPSGVTAERIAGMFNVELGKAHAALMKVRELGLISAPHNRRGCCSWAPTYFIVYTDKLKPLPGEENGT